MKSHKLSSDRHVIAPKLPPQNRVEQDAVIFKHSFDANVRCTVWKDVPLFT